MPTARDSTPSSDSSASRHQSWQRSHTPRELLHRLVPHPSLALCYEVRSAQRARFVFARRKAGPQERRRAQCLCQGRWTERAPGARPPVRVQGLPRASSRRADMTGAGIASPACPPTPSRPSAAPWGCLDAVAERAPASCCRCILYCNLHRTTMRSASKGCTFCQAAPPPHIADPLSGVEPYPASLRPSPLPSPTFLLPPVRNRLTH